MAITSIGRPKTTKYRIGPSEARVGPLSEAMRLTRAHSVGMIDSASFNRTTTSADLMYGLPQVEVDTQVVTTSNTGTITLREFSSRNMRLMLGNGVQSYSTKYDTTVATAAAADGTSLEVVDASGFAQGDIIVIVPDGNVDNVTVTRVASIATNTITLDSGLGLLTAVSIGDLVYKSAVTSVGVSSNEYFSVSFLTVDREGNPTGYHFWKATLSGDATDSMGGTEFGSNELTLKFLQPAESEYTSGGDLEHVAELIQQHPIGFNFQPGDLNA